MKRCRLLFGGVESEFFYQAYDLCINSEVELPELPSPTALKKRDDVFIEVGTNLKNKYSDVRQVGPLLWASGNCVRLKVPRIAEYVIEDGNRIYVQPLKGIGLEGARAFLHSLAFPCLSYQRGFVVLKGNAVANDIKCGLFLGSTRGAKSTLAASMLRYGFALLSDEIIAIDDAGYCHPGCTLLRLWPDAIQTLKLARHQLVP